MAAHWRAVPELAERLGISRQSVHEAIKRGAWHGAELEIRKVGGSRGGKAGRRYEVLLSSLPEALQERFRASCEPPPKFIVAPNQSAEIDRRIAVLQRIWDTEAGTTERTQAMRDASYHHDVPLRTVQRWVKQCEDHGWDMDAFGRKKPANAGQQRVWISRQFDKCWRDSGLAENELAELGEWVTRKLAGWWQSPAQRAGWKRVRLEALTDLKRKCRERGLSLPRSAFHLSRRRVEELRHHSIVDVMGHDAKRFDDMKPRIRRNNALFEPMEQVVMDVKPLDCVLLRPDGTRARPRFIAFQDTGTMRITGRVILLPKGEGVRQEHVTDAFIAMVANPDWGFPQQIYRDNGSEYLHFDLIREALKSTAKEGVRVIINAKPYSGASKPIESRFARIDTYVTSQMAGYVGPDITDNKTQQVGKNVTPYPGPIEEFEAEFMLRLADLEGREFETGPFQGRSPVQIYMDHVTNGWRPVSVHPLALDEAFAKPIGDRKVDRGAITIGPNRYRHPELAAFTGRRVRVVQPYRRDANPLADLPEVGWIALQPEMLHLPGDISGAIESSRMQKARTAAVRKLKSQAAPVDPLANVHERVAQLPTVAAPAPLIPALMSPEAERFAGARIKAERKRAAQPSEQERLIAHQLAETEELEQYYARKK